MAQNGETSTLESTGDEIADVMPVRYRKGRPPRRVVLGKPARDPSVRKCPEERYDSEDRVGFDDVAPVRGSSGFAGPPKRLRNGHIGASAPNISSLDLLAGCTPQVCD
jgi:hypothetical protein